MKTVIAIVMIVALAALPAQAQGKAQPKPRGDGKPAVEEAAPIMLGLLVLTCAAVGAYVVIKVCSSNDYDKGPVDVILEKSPDNVNWTEVARKRVTLNGKKPVEFFEEVRRDGYSFYRGRVEKAM